MCKDKNIRFVFPSAFCILHITYIGNITCGNLLLSVPPNVCGIISLWKCTSLVFRFVFAPYIFVRDLSAGVYTALELSFVFHIISIGECLPLTESLGNVYS